MEEYGWRGMRSCETIAAQSDTLLSKFRAHDRRGERSASGGELLLERLDVLFVQADRLPQPGNALGILLRDVLLLDRRRRRPVGVGRARLLEQLLFGDQFLVQYLAPDVVAALLGRRIDFGKTRRRRGAARRGPAPIALAGHSGNVEIGGVATLRHALVRTTFDARRAPGAA